MALGVFAVWLARPAPRVGAADPLPDAPGVAVYDPKPTHLWNRLHEALAVRPDGKGPSYPGELDPFLGRRRPDDATGARYKRALPVLDEFIAERGDRLITDPRKRALLQCDLWVLFDTVAPSRYLAAPSERDGELELARRAARILPQLALTADQIKALPDTYAEAVAAKEFPDGFDVGRLWAADGPWVLLGSAERTPVARSHVEFFGGRSAFFVFLRLPGGREQTRKYVAELRPDRNAPKLPQGSLTALVRQMQLIDDHGRINLTPVVEAVQIRGRGEFEFQLDRKAFLAGKPSLRALGPEDRERSYLSFLGHNAGDGRPKVLETCFHCHHEAVAALNSYGRPFPPAQSIRPQLLASSRDEEALRARLWKKERYEWGLLQGLLLSPKAE
jgi:hypothetical protein